MRTKGMATALLMVLALAFTVRAAEKTATVHGYVLDSACAFSKNLDKPISRDCALACAKAGSPLLILADDGTIVTTVTALATLKT